MTKPNDWPMMSPTLRDLHGAWHACTQRERAEFMEAVGLRGILKGPVGPQRQEDIHERLEDDDETQETATEALRQD